MHIKRIEFTLLNTSAGREFGVCQTKGRIMREASIRLVIAIVTFLVECTDIIKTVVKLYKMCGLLQYPVSAMNTMFRIRSI
jgi:hypothetical protein